MLLGDPIRLQAKARKGAALAMVVLALVASVAISLWGPDPALLAPLGYPGIALLLFLASGTIVLPAPGFAAVMVAGVTWNPWLVGIAGGIGAGVGEITGYMVGAGGENSLTRCAAPTPGSARTNGSLSTGS